MFKKSVSFSPAWDKRSDKPFENYGIGAVKIRFVLKGDKGAVQFIISSGWYLPGCGSRDINHPMGFDVGYHAYLPQYEDQEQREECDILDCKEGGCYYDGSTLQAEELLAKLIAEGDKVVWDELRRIYKERFSDIDINEINKRKGV